MDKLQKLNRQVAMNRICDHDRCRERATCLSLDEKYYMCHDHRNVGMILSKGSEVRHHRHGHVGKITMETSTDWGIYWYGGFEGKEHGDRIRQHGLLPFWQRKGVEKHLTT